jgi:hypothetical protein
MIQSTSISASALILATLHVERSARLHTLLAYGVIYLLIIVAVPKEAKIRRAPISSGHHSQKLSSTIRNTLGVRG